MGEAHAGAVAEFFRAVWDSAATAESVWRGLQTAAERNPFFPGQHVQTVLFLSDERVVGYATSIPVSVWGACEERRAEWIKGLIVIPEHRNGPVGFKLVKELLRRLE